MITDVNINNLNFDNEQFSKIINILKEDSDYFFKNN